MKKEILIVDNIKDKIAFNIKNKSNFFIFGYSDFGKQIYKYLKKFDIKNIYFCDNFQAGKKISLPDLSCSEIIFPQNILRFSDPEKIVVCIASVAHAKELIRQIKSYGISNYINFHFLEMDVYNKHFSSDTILKNMDKIRKVYEMLEDKVSKKTFLNILKYRLTSDPLNIFESKYSIYYNPEVIAEERDLIIDGGAYLGETALDWFNYLDGKCNIISFEPFNDNYKKIIQENIEYTKKWKIERFALFSEQTKFSMHVYKKHGNVAAHLSKPKKGNQIQTISLDDYINKNQIRPTLIKLDIEGSELEALKGMRQYLKKYKPKMLLSIYHKPEDIFKLPLELKKIRNDYKFYLGHHSQRIWDTVLYAK